MATREKEGGVSLCVPDFLGSLTRILEKTVSAVNVTESLHRQPCRFSRWTYIEWLNLYVLVSVVAAMVAKARYAGLKLAGKKILEGRSLVKNRVVFIKLSALSHDMSKRFWEESCAP